MDKNDRILQEIASQKQEAWDARDLETFDLYHSIEFELVKLRAVGKAAASLYKNTSNEQAWDAMYEVLSDAGLLDVEE
jgi:hypothetical protein